MSNQLISIRNLSYKYASSKNYSLGNIFLEIKSSERFGIFGPNGAGKTTLISLICNILPIQSGEVLFFENNQKSDFKNIKNKIGFVPQNLALYDELSAAQNIEYFGALCNLKSDEIKKQTDRLLNLLGLSNVRNNKIKTFSGGMKRRLNLIISVIHNPTILFLDEPTVGIDIQSKNAIIEFLFSLNKAGVTIIYTSHHLEEAEQLCNKIAILDYGQLIACEQTENLLANYDVNNLSELLLKLTGKEFRDNV